MHIQFEYDLWPPNWHENLEDLDLVKISTSQRKYFLRHGLFKIRTIVDVNRYMLSKTWIACYCILWKFNNLKDKLGCWQLEDVQFVNRKFGWFKSIKIYPKTEHSLLVALILFTSARFTSWTRNSRYIMYIIETCMLLATVIVTWALLYPLIGLVKRWM